MSDNDPEGIQLKNKMYSIGIQDNKIIKTILEKPEMRKKLHKWFYDYNHKKKK